MSCKCFVKSPIFKKDSSFEMKIEMSKCTCNARFCVTENKSSFCIDSKEKKKIEKIKIDKCLNNSSEHRKCDYLFIYNSGNKQSNIYIFVELKGEDIAHAVTQIENSINIFLENGHLIKEKVIGAIVNSRNPSNDGSYRKAKLRIERLLAPKLKYFRVEKSYRRMIYDPINDKVIK